MYMNIVIDRHYQGGGLESNVRRFFEHHPGSPKTRGIDRTTFYLHFKTNFRSIRPLIIEIQLSEV